MPRIEAAHNRAADAHQRAAEVHDQAARLFESHGEPERAVRERGLARMNRAAGVTERERARLRREWNHLRAREGTGELGEHG